MAVWARDTSDNAVKGFLVEKGTPGYNATVMTGKASLRAVWQAEIQFDDMRIPAENRLPGANSFKAIHTFEGTATVQTLLVGRDITGVAAFTQALGPRARTRRAGPKTPRTKMGLARSTLTLRFSAELTRYHRIRPGGTPWRSPLNRSLARR